MQIALLKQSHEDLFLEEGFVFALQFDEGWVVGRVTGREVTNLAPYQLAASLAAGTATAAWDELLAAGTQTRQLEPPDSAIINHAFWGVSNPKVRIYLQYMSRQNRLSLINTERVVGGPVGYIEGAESPYGGPFSRRTELFVVDELYPAFMAYNPLADAMGVINMSLSIARYHYQLIKSQSEVRAILLGERRRKLHTMGGIDPSPIKLPKWLRDQVGDPLLSYTKSIMEAQ